MILVIAYALCVLLYLWYMYDTRPHSIKEIVIGTVLSPLLWLAVSVNILIKAFKGKNQ